MVGPRDGNPEGESLEERAEKGTMDIVIGAGSKNNRVYVDASQSAEPVTYRVKIEKDAAQNSVGIKPGSIYQGYIKVDESANDNQVDVAPNVKPQRRGLFRLFYRH